MIKKQLILIICIAFLFAPNLWSAQVAIVSTDTRQEAWAKETLNNSDLQTNIDGKQAASSNLTSINQDLANTDSPAFNAMTLTGTNTLALGTFSTTDGMIFFNNATNANTFTIETGVTGAAIGWTTPTAAPGGADYLLNVDVDGTMGYTDPSTLGGASPLTTKGDLFTYTTVDARLAIGTNDYILTADSAEASGMKWAPASGGSTTVNALGDATAAGAVDFVTYLQQWDVGTAGFQIGDGGSNYAAFDVTGNISFGGTGGLTGNIVSDYITFTPSATPAATTDGLLRNVTGLTGLASDTFSFFDGSVAQYLLNYDTLPTVNGSMPTYNAANDDFDWTVPAGTTVASSAEVNTGTDNAKFISPDALAGSNAFTKEVAWTIYDSTTDTAVADGLQFFIVPTSYNGMNLIEIIASVETAGTTGTTDIQIRRVRGATAADMLSTIATIDTGERDTTTAATPYVINAANDDLATADRIFIDLDAVSTTAAKGLSVTALFRLP